MKYKVVWREHLEDGKISEKKMRSFSTVEEAAEEGYKIFRRKETFAAWLVLPSGTDFPFVQGGLYV